MLQRFPRAAWHAHEPVGDDAARAGAALAYGRRCDVLPRLDHAEVVLALDADPLGPGPDQIRNARGLAARRDPQGGDPVLPPLCDRAAPTLTGAKADNRLALHPRHIHNAALAVAEALGAGLPQPALPAQAAKFVDAARARPAGAAGARCRAGRRASRRRRMRWSTGSMPGCRRRST